MRPAPGTGEGNLHFARQGFKIPGGDIVGARGPLPDLKVVDGTYQPPANTPKAKPVLPKCPAWLSKEAKKEWRRVAGPLYRAGLLTELDKNTLAMYCQTWGRFEQCQKILAQEGDTYVQVNGEPKQRPEYYIMKDGMKELRALITLFGLAPGPRMRMELPEPPARDEMEDLLNGF
jgi:P27 family predicted phage terminase small subunit